MMHRTFEENDDFGITYVMWFCRECNVMCTSPHDHNVNRHPERVDGKYSHRPKDGGAA